MKVTRLVAVGAIAAGAVSVAGGAQAAELPDCTGARVVTQYYWATDSTRPTGCDLDPPQTLSIRVPVRDASDRPLQRAYHVLAHYGCAPTARLVVRNGQLFEVGDRCDY